jgi:hypothetical protein
MIAHVCGLFLAFISFLQKTAAKSCAAREEIVNVEEFQSYECVYLKCESSKQINKK